jgi:hypothetical protein
MENGAIDLTTYWHPRILKANYCFVIDTIFLPTCIFLQFIELTANFSGAYNFYWVNENAILEKIFS